MPTIMNPDAFEGSETVERASMETIRERVRTLTTPRMGDGPELVPIQMSPAQIAAYQELGYDYATAAHLAIVDGIIEQDATAQDMRLKSCGMVWHEDQLDSRRWVSPTPPTGPGTIDSRIKVLPLFMVKPTPGLEITATDGEKYLLPKDFKGGWLDIAGPSGRKLIS